MLWKWLISYLGVNAKKDLHLPPPLLGDRPSNLRIIVKIKDGHSESNTWIHSSSFWSWIYEQLLQQSEFRPRYIWFNHWSFLYVLLCKMERCFAGTSTRKYYIKPPNYSTIHNKGGSILIQKFMCQIFTNLQAKLFLEEFSESSRLGADGLNHINHIN